MINDNSVIDAIRFEELFLLPCTWDFYDTIFTATFLTC